MDLVTVAEDTSDLTDPDVVGPAADSGPFGGDGGGGSRGGAAVPGQPARVPRDDLDAPRAVARAALIVLATIALSLVLQLALVSALQHRVAQRRAFDRLRNVLALGTAPVSQTDSSGRVLALGTPIALIDIPSLRLHEVVEEGTTPGVLMSGPGHRRDTPLPGQAGTSVVMGRQAAFGGPFRRLHELRPGMHIVVTTGQGTSTFSVIRVRRGGDPTPPPVASGKGRLTLITASGTPFVPSGVLRVDADLATPTMATPPSVIPLNGVPRSEMAMGADTSTLWTLALWLEALTAVAVAAVWSCYRWGHHQAWIVFVPLVALVGLFVAGQTVKLLPNLL